MRSPLLLLLSSACAGTDTPEPLVGGDTCIALTAGTWTFAGPAWGMGEYTMQGDLTLDATACTFTLTAWDMAMDDLPSGGAVDDVAVQFDGLNSYWRSCTGTATDQNHADGLCADDGAAWSIDALIL